jgi:DNA-binding response OmpR family regulator
MAHILIIEDDTILRESLRLALEELGYRVSEASDGRMGLAAHRSTPVDLVITDLIMPGMEGIETIKKFKRLSPSVKIIAISGGGVGKGADYLSMAGKLGANRTLAKPFSMEELAPLVAEVLKK